MSCIRGSSVLCNLRGSQKITLLPAVGSIVHHLPEMTREEWRIQISNTWGCFHLASFFHIPRSTPIWKQHFQQPIVQNLFASFELEVRKFTKFLNMASVFNILITCRTSEVQDIGQEIKENGRKTSAKGLWCGDSLANHEGHNVIGLTRSINIFHPWQGGAR